MTLAIGASALCMAVAQQNRQMDAPQQEAVIAKINGIAASIKTMQCSFVQTKHLSLLKDVMVSKGKMYYEQGQRLRWEYTSPYTYVFVLNGNQVTLKSSQSKNEIDIQQNKVFQEIAHIMMSTVTGKCLSDAKSFKVSISAENNRWIASLMPLKKEMKQMFSTIRLSFNSVQPMIESVEMHEKNGDKTVIELKEIKTNIPIDEKVFMVR